jgi:hypothetical protein
MLKMEDWDSAELYALQALHALPQPLTSLVSYYPFLYPNPNPNPTATVQDRAAERGPKQSCRAGQNAVERAPSRAVA